MEKLKSLVKQWRLAPGIITEQDVLNRSREYLQILILKIIYQSKFGTCLSFMGGTCLRICYDLKRYSEDLDFSLYIKKKSYSFNSLISLLEKELTLQGLKVSTSVSWEKRVQKAFLHFSNLPEDIGIKGYRKGQKLHIKIEVDTNPPSIKKGERESFFVNRFDEIYPILKHNLPTLFAGKILAILYRPYARGRDYYDLIWYLSRKTPLNLTYLNHAIKKGKFKNEAEVWETLQKKIKTLDPHLITKDMVQFLEDATEVTWISKYQTLFQQLIFP